ncbi:MAG: hypothetical protein IJX80_09985 [Clostridia bacterium]|nr:hypothetical protein [Clostridia bacterium]
MISKIQEINGNKMIVIDGEVYLPVAYRSFRPIPSNVNQFHRSGVKLYQMQVTGRNNAHGVPYSYYGGIWNGYGDYDFSAFDRQIQMFKKFAPGCKIMVMLQLDPPLWWLKDHPNSHDSYWRIGEAPFDEAWRHDVTEYAKAFLKYAEDTYGEDIFAYSFSSGIATEWFDSTEYYEPSDKKKAAFEAYSKGLTTPTEAELSDTEGICMREPASKEAAYRNFCCTLTPELIKYFSALFKHETERQKIIGLFFGYTDCPNEGFQILSATNGYEAVWQDENIDMLFSPASYSFDDNVREIDGASSYQYLVDSITVNNKLYLHEIDHRTHLADFPLENGFILPAYPDLHTTVEVLRRELAATLCKGGSLWWFDFYGSYYACPELEAEIAKQIDIFKEVTRQAYRSVSEIAVFADPMGFNLLKENLNLTVDYVRKNRNNLHKCGAPFDYYNLSDITKIDLTPYKMLVFLFAPTLSSEIKATLAGLDDKLKVWVHLPDVASSGALDFSAVGTLCGMTMAEETASQSAVHNGTTFGFSTAVSPLLQVTDKDACVLARYENGDVAAALKNNTAYIALGNAPSSLWRELAAHAGVHAYTEKEVPVYADSRFVACQFPNAATDIITTETDGDYVEVFTKKHYRAKNRQLTFAHDNYQMMLFLKEN